MEPLEEIQEAIEAKRQEKTPEAKESDANKEMQTVLAHIEQMKFAKNQDFKEGAIEIIKQVIEWCMELQQHHEKEIKEMTDALQDRFKIMDETITDLVKFRQGVEDLRFFLLFHIAKSDYAFDKLVEMGLIERWTKEIYQNIWNDERISMLGFDCNAEELKKKMADTIKNAENKGPHDQMAAVPQ